jgi:hypothetical protein
LGTSLDITPSGALVTTDPAVDTEISYTTLYDYKVNLIRIPFVPTGAGTRTIVLKITVPTTKIIYNVPISAAITATSGAHEIMFGEGLPHAAVGTTYMVPLPHGLKLPRGSVIETVTAGLVVTDNFGAAVLFLDKLN